MTYEDILREFAAFGVGVDRADVGVCVRRSPDPFRIDHLFDVDDPDAMAEEVCRLETERARRDIPRISRAERRRLIAMDRRLAKRLPCKACGGSPPANRLGVIALHCNATCRSIALCLRRAAEKKCRRARCLHGAELGKTYCRGHLDELSARERERRRQRKAA